MHAYVPEPLTFGSLVFGTKNRIYFRRSSFLRVPQTNSRSQIRYGITNIFIVENQLSQVTIRISFLLKNHIRLFQQSQLRSIYIILNMISCFWVTILIRVTFDYLNYELISYPSTSSKLMRPIYINLAKGLIDLWVHYAKGSSYYRFVIEFNSHPSALHYSSTTQ